MMRIIVVLLIIAFCTSCKKDQRKMEVIKPLSIKQVARNRCDSFCKAYHWPYKDRDYRYHSMLIMKRDDSLCWRALCKDWCYNYDTTLYLDGFSPRFESILDTLLMANDYKEIILGTYRLPYLPDQLFSQTQLGSLKIIQSKIVELQDGCDGLPNLITLDLSEDHNLRELPPTLLHCHKLKYISLIGTSISKNDRIVKWLKKANPKIEINFEYLDENCGG